MREQHDHHGSRAAPLAVALLTVGCLSDPPTDPRRDAPLRLSIRAQVVGAGSANVIAVDVYYERDAALPPAERPHVSLLQREISPDAGTRRLALAVDVVPCLLDDRRVEPTADECVLHVATALIDGDGHAVDYSEAQLVAAPGGAATVPDVTLTRQAPPIAIDAQGSMLEGVSRPLTVRFLDARGILIETSVAGRTDSLAGRPLLWTSSDPSVARVSALGVVTAVLPGTATITATREGRQASALVSVTPDVVGSVTVAPSAAVVATGESAQLGAQVYGSVQNPLSGRPVSWTSSDPAVAAVTSSGLVTGIAPGTATITASRDGRSDAVAIDVAFAFRSISLSPGGNAPFHSCAIGLADGAGYCWGQNNSGQIGDGTTGTNALLAHRIQFADGPLAAISAGIGYSCAVTTAGPLLCWGANGGNFANGTTPASAVPTIAGTSPVLAVITAGNVSCGLDAAAVGYCRASGSTFGQLAPNLRWRTLRGGFNNSCGLTTAGEVYCWGFGGFGANGTGASSTGTTTGPTTPVAVPDGPVRAYADGANFACALNAAGKAYCWGINNSGQLGIPPATTSAPAPVPVETNLAFTAIAAGTSHACGLTQGGEVWCWGSNASGQLGDGSTTSTSVPVRVAGGLAYAQLAAGGASTCALTAGGVAWCWGANFAGQLGDGTTVQRATPVYARTR